MADVTHSAIIGSGYACLVKNDTILNGVRFYRVGSQVHTARVITYRDLRREWLNTWKFLCGDKATYPGVIPADIQGLIRPLFQEGDREVFIHMLTAALEHGNIAEAVGAFQEDWCWAEVASYTNWHKFELLIGRLNPMHRKEYRALICRGGDFAYP